MFLPEGVGRGLLMVVKLLVVRSRCEMACRWSGVASIVSSTMGLGGMAQWRLGVRCAEMDSRKRRKLSGVLVVSTAARPGNVQYNSEDGLMAGGCSGLIPGRRPGSGACRTGGCPYPAGVLVGTSGLRCQVWLRGLFGIRPRLSASLHQLDRSSDIFVA